MRTEEQKKKYKEILKKKKKLRKLSINIPRIFPFSLLLIR